MALRQIGEILRAFARFQRGAVAASDLDRSKCRNETGESLDQRGLAGAVRSDQGHQFAGGQREADIVDDGAAAEADGDIACHEERIGHAVSPSRNRRSLKIIARKNGTPIKRGDHADLQLDRGRHETHGDVGGEQQRRAGERARAA